MKILITVNMRNLMDTTAKMALDEQLPDFAAKTLAVSLRDKAETNARTMIENGGFGQDLANGVRVKTNNREIIIAHASNDTNHLLQSTYMLVGPTSTRLISCNTKRQIGKKDLSARYGY